MADLLLFVAEGTTFTGGIPPGTSHCRLPTDVAHEVHGGISRLRIASIDRDVGASGELTIGGQVDTTSVGLGRTGQDVNVYGLLSMPSSAWDDSRLKFTVGGNTWHFWVDVTGTLRFKNGAPASDTDGSVVGGADVSTLVFRPGGTAANNVFTTWDDVYTKAQALEGPVVLQVDDSMAPAVLGGALGPYDLSGLTIVGRDPSSTSVLSVLTVDEPLSGLPECVGCGVALLNGMLTPAYTSSGGERLIIDPKGVVAGSASAPFVEITGGVFTVQLGGALGNVNPSINIAAAGTLDVLALEQSAAPSGAVSSALGATYNANHFGTSANISDQSGFVSFNGSFNRTLSNLSEYMFYDNGGGPLVSSDVQAAIDELAAAAGGSSKWADPGAYLYPLSGATKEVVVGDTTAPVGGEKLRVRSDSGGPAIRGEGDIVIADEAAYPGSAGAWNGPHFVMGPWHFWVDGSGNFRLSSGAPASDVDGVVVGVQGG